MAATAHTTRWFMRLSGLLLLAAAVCVVVFLRMPGRSAEYVHVAGVDLDRAPEDGVVTSGPLRWDVAMYAEAPSLEPLRKFLREQCPNLGGLDAAVCIADVFAGEFAEDDPAREFFDPKWDPVEDLNAHLDGAAGHCVTRSGLSAAILLAGGIPARVVQLFSLETPGHNILEVWDGRWGWVVFDPTLERLFESGNGPRSAAAALVNHVAGHWVERGKRPVVDGHAFYASLSKGGADASIRFPEPWLYTRTGPHVARWPYRAVFVHGGTFRWEEGRGQEFLRPLIVLLSFAAAATAAAGYTLGRRRSRRSVVEAPDEIAAA